MKRRTKLTFAAVGATALAAIGPALVLAAGDTDDHLSLTKTAESVALKTGTKAVLNGTLNGSAVTSTCTSSTTSFTTPATGLGPVTTKAPTFTGCTDSFGGKDTVKTSGTWTVKFVDAANDETKEVAGDKLALTIPKGGATLVSSLLPTCTITIAPSAAATISGAYNDVNTLTITKAPVPAATSATCPGGAKTSTATFSATYVLSKSVHDVS